MAELLTEILVLLELGAMGIDAGRGAALLAADPVPLLAHHATEEAALQR
jgi:hypothetical protein